MTIAQVSDVRAAQALGSPSDQTAAATDDQLNAALRLGAFRMREITGDLYDEVYGYNGLVEWKRKRLQDFTFAESCFALGALPQVLAGAQKSKTGVKRSSKIGDATTEFASADDGQNERQVWEADGYRALAPYLTTKITGDSGKTIGARNKRSTFSISATD